jgi:hypothetical protein
MRLHFDVGWLGLAAGILWMSAGPVLAQSPAVPLDELPAAVRESVRRVMQQPSLSASGPAEDFAGRPTLYHWLLDHPDRAAQAWRRLGAPCMEIADRGAGRFGWADQQGSDLSWETIYRSPEMRVWYAQGRVRPGVLLPPLGVRAVVVLRHADYQDAGGKTHIHHQADLFVQTDSKTASLVARLIGPAAPHLTEQCISQLEIFFSALTRYLDRHPEYVEVLLSEERPFGSLPIRPKDQFAQGSR